MLRMHRSVTLFATLALCAAVAPSASATVSLSFRPVMQNRYTNQIVEIDFVATSDSASPQLVGAIDAILSWDPTKLLLLGVSDAHAGYDWFLDGFPNNIDGLNNGVVTPWMDTPTNDGSAMYTALAQFTLSAAAPPGPAGLIVTTLRFRALAATSATVVSLQPSFGMFSQTRVLDGDPSMPNHNITGNIAGTATVTIIDCAGQPRGDSNCDGFVDNFDIDAFVYGIIFQQAAWEQLYSCNFFCAIDINGDGLANNFDIDPFVLCLTVGCP